IERQKFNALLAYCETLGCRRQVLLKYFGETFEPCGNCDNCVTPPVVQDSTEAAQMALSCIYRTGQRFGSGHIIDILMGADTDKVRSAGHDVLPLYGKGTAYNRHEWQALVRQLLSLDYITQDIEGFGGLSLNEKCRPLLRAEETFSTRKYVSPKKQRNETRITAPVNPEDMSLYESLKALRLEIAKDGNIPPYVVFHDKTLLEMANLKPTSLTAFAEIQGVGDSKLKRYGNQFLEILKAQ
ncbi:MAG: HRDC domain-containing protein, partial [Sneathiella sp.]|nr:HRDC domain-containing protein [Sneathiella sp.]